MYKHSSGKNKWIFKFKISCIGFCMSQESQYLTVLKNVLFPKSYMFLVFQHYLEKEKKMSAATSMAVLARLIVSCSYNNRCHVVNNE